MKIADSTVNMYSAHSSIEQHQRAESLTLWRSGRETREDLEKGERSSFFKVAARSFERASRVSLSFAALRSQPVKTVVPKIAEKDEKMTDLTLQILEKLFENITGRKMHIMKMEDIFDGVASDVVGLNDQTGLSADSSVQSAAKPESGNFSEGEGGWGLAYDYYESHYEYESTSFASGGKILTEDGQAIDFDVELNMSREFYTEQSLNLRMGEALKDPLVINFNGTAAELTQNKFAFDIDMDGRKEQISFVKNNSGFLALDKNGDNIINDGSELFGPTTGKGFEELALYDLDGNGWIDENDDIFNKLRIWMKDENGEDRLMALGEKGIGAIYLGHVDSPFALKDEENNLLGQVASCGVFLHEDGRSGTVQQIDLAV